MVLLLGVSYCHRVLGSQEDNDSSSLEDYGWKGGNGDSNWEIQGQGMGHKRGKKDMGRLESEEKENVEEQSLNLVVRLEGEGGVKKNRSDEVVKNDQQSSRGGEIC